MKLEYLDEKRAIADSIYNILDMKNNYFLLCDLDKDIEKQEKILALTNDIKKYFKVRDLSYLIIKNIKRPYISLIRSIFKYMNFKIFIETVNIKIQDNQKGFIRTQKYTIFKPNEIIIN